MTDMNNKVAHIIGASSGIAFATARAFAAQGSKVVLAERPDDFDDLIYPGRTGLTSIHIK